MTHRYDGELVVFMIGMRINQWWRIDRWLPVMLKMPIMLRELASAPGSGLLGYRIVPDPRGPWLIQYWDSLDRLYDYANDGAARHRPAWAAFNQRTRASGAVGAWHETFVVRQAETIYVNTPVLGLAAATVAEPVDAGTDTARQRIRRRRP
jgi:hypothetical protein